MWVMLPTHAQGVEPEGNLLLRSREETQLAHAARRAGLGIFAQLSDATILRICSCATPGALGALSVASDMCNAFASFEEHWRIHSLVRAARAPVTFCGAWKATFLTAVRAQSGVTERQQLPPQRKRGVSIASDALYLSHQLAHGSNHFGSPRGPPVARITKGTAPDLPAFTKEFEEGIGKPVVIAIAGASGADSSTWDEDSLRLKLGDRVFHAGGANFQLADYLDYAATNADDQPLYLFDPTFGRSAPELLDAYERPAYFRDDLFDLLDDDRSADRGGRDGVAGAERPDYRWLLIGGHRSGQAWHTDPNATSAWNLTLRGRKRWLFFPPHIPPPGVFPSADGGGDYVTPLVLEEWARDFYQEACRMPGFCETESGPGDATFVPRGWWHMVLNLAPLTIAVSHHFLSPAGLHATLRLLRETPCQVSGIDRGLARDRSSDAGSSDATPAERQADDDARRRTAGSALHDRLMEKLQASRPEALRAAELLLREEDSRRGGAVGLLKKLVAPETAPASFSFGFG